MSCARSHHKRTGSRSISARLWRNIRKSIARAWRIEDARVESHSDRVYRARWPEGLRGVSRMIGPSLYRSLIAFALIFATGWLGYLLPSMGGRLPLMLLPSGIAVAALCRWGIRHCPAVLLGGTAIDLSSGSSALDAAGVGVGLAAAAALTCRILDWGG